MSDEPENNYDDDYQERMKTIYPDLATPPSDTIDVPPAGKEQLKKLITPETKLLQMSPIALDVVGGLKNGLPKGVRGGTDAAGANPAPSYGVFTQGPVPENYIYHISKVIYMCSMTSGGGAAATNLTWGFNLMVDLNAILRREMTWGRMSINSEVVYEIVYDIDYYCGPNSSVSIFSLVDYNGGCPDCFIRQDIQVTGEFIPASIQIKRGINVAPPATAAAFNVASIAYNRW